MNGNCSQLSQRQRCRRTPFYWLVIVPAILLAALLFIPLAALLARLSPAMFVHYLGDSATTQAISLSFTTTVSALAVTLALGTPLAYVLGRWRFPGINLVEVLVDLPTVLPPAVAGIALLLALGRRGLIGVYLQRAGIDISFTPVAVIIAQIFVAAPYYIKSASIALAGVSDELIEVAEMDGASLMQGFWSITLPLSLRGIVGGAALCWSRTLGEFGATIIFAGNFPGRTQTMPLLVYLGFESGMQDQALTVACILLVVSFAMLLTIRSLMRPVTL